MKLFGVSNNCDEELLIIGLSKRTLSSLLLLLLLLFGSISLISFSISFLSMFSILTSSPPNVFLITFKFWSNSAAFCF